MEFLLALWAPILANALLLFFVSALAWMALPHHRMDYGPLDQEDELLAQIRRLGIPPGRYAVPYFGSNQNSKDPERRKKLMEGPTGIVTVFPTLNMGRNMVLTFIFFLVSSALLAYLGWITVGEEKAPSFARILRVIGTAGVLTYSCAAVPNDIWFKRPLATNLIDGVIYGLISGAVFAALWP